MHRSRKKGDANDSVVSVGRVAQFRYFNDVAGYSGVSRNFKFYYSVLFFLIRLIVIVLLTFCVDRFLFVVLIPIGCFLQIEEN